MQRYWVYIDSKVQGPVDVPALRKISNFTLLTQVCAENEQTWRMADEIIEIKSYFLSPPRASALMAEAVNAAPLPKESGTLLTVIEPDPVVESTRPLPAPLPGGMPEPAVVKIPLNAVTPAMGGPKEQSGALRLYCAVCGYKNPRDVTSCMKCGTPIQTPSPEKGEGGRRPDEGPSPRPSPGKVEGIPTPSASPAKAPEPAAIPVDLKASQMIEIPVTRILLTLLAASLVGALGFGGYKFWVMHHHRPRKVVMKPVMTVPTVVVRAPGATRVGGKKGHRLIPRAKVVALPGISQIRSSSISKPRKPLVEPVADPSQAAAPYRVIEEAAPLKHRQPAPVNSPYAVKRRKNAALWSAQEQQAIQQVQRYRIYGGQRTIERNADILMQILRDREYSTAFESGKRLYLYNDMDWGVAQQDGPVYEVRLTFSGGKENDGTSRQPLKFSFTTDLERGSVEPGGAELLQANTMHAFFDESRIPPEERRAIAKDTEELVLAAQPDGSPLALDTVAKHFEATYDASALARVAAAFKLNLVAKKIEHEPKRVQEETVFGTADVKKTTPPVEKTPTESPKTKPVSATPSSRLEFQMENGAGREKLVSVNVPSQASAARIWEVLTNYDGLKQFVPDLLVSEREGQDGGAIIVHTVSLARLLFFVFKVNLHLRLIEHPDQHTIEFERIAGEFEQFRGAIELKSESAGGPATIAFHATVVPQGHMPAWVMRDMTKRFFVPVIDALRVRAESN